MTIKQENEASPLAQPIAMNERYFSGPPVCSHCKQPTSRGSTAANNILGNAGRAYYSCTTPECPGFYCFDGHRGIRDENPPCLCRRPSRGRIGGKALTTPLILYSNVRLGSAGIQRGNKDGSGNRISVALPDIDRWIEEEKL